MTSNMGVEDVVLSDAELIAAARMGDSAAFGHLYERHAGAAWLVARQYTNSAADAEDAVADAFTKVWTIIQGGGGPDVAFRAYLFTVVRRVGMLRVQGGRRVEPTDDVATFEDAIGAAESTEGPAMAGFERGVVAKAYRTLPERWQAVLWYTEVEALTPAQIAPLLGLTANGVAALAYRAREGLRQAYLQQHLQEPIDDGCRVVSGKLGSYVRGGLARRETAAVDEHLETCGRCRALLLELGDVNHGMRGVIAPLVLGLLGLGALAQPLPVGGGLAAGAAALGAAGGAAAGGAAGAGGSAGGAAGGAGGAGAAAGGGAAGGGAAATGAVAAVGAGSVAGGVGVVGGLAALIGTVPFALVAAAAALVVVGGVAVAGALGVFSPSSDQAAAPGAVSATSTEDVRASTVTAAPTAVPSPAPTALPTAVPSPQPTAVPTPVRTAPVPSPTATPVKPPDTVLTVSDPVASPEPSVTPEPTPLPTAEPTAEPTPTPSPTSTPPPVAAVALAVSTPMLTLVPSTTASDLTIDITNTGTADAAALTADVQLPAGVSVAPATLTASLARTAVAGRFAAGGVPVDWTCVPATDPQHSECSLERLAAGATARLTLTVVVAEDVQATDAAAITIAVHGAGFDDVTLSAPASITASPARLTLDAQPAPIALTASTSPGQSEPETTSHLELALANAGELGTTGARVVLTLPPHVHVVDGTAGRPWTCTTDATDATSDVVTCVLAELGGRPARTTLGVDLFAEVGAGDTVDPAVRIALAPDAPRLSQDLAVALEITTPAPAHVHVSASPTSLYLDTTTPARAQITATDVGGLPATGTRVLVTLPVGALWPGVGSAAWTCTGAVAGRATGAPTSFECVVPRLAAGGVSTLTLDLVAGSGAHGALGELVAALTPGDGGEGSSATVSLTARTPTGNELLPRFGITGGWNVTEIGAPLMTCANGSSIQKSCVAALTGASTTGSIDNNDFVMRRLIEPGTGGTVVSSSAFLDIPADRAIAFAGLYWSASHAGSTSLAARLSGPDATSTDVTGTILFQRDGGSGVARGQYQAFADVTAQVAALGRGTWTVADIADPVVGDASPGTYAGWALVVVYADTVPGTVTVFDGGMAVGASDAVLSIPTVAGASTRIGVVAWEGDRGIHRDLLTLAQVALTPARFGVHGNAVAGDPDNAFDATATGWTPQYPSSNLPDIAVANSLGVDAKGFAPVTAGPGASSTLTATTSSDQFVLGAVTVRSR